MKNGIYHVKFSVPGKPQNEGLVVMKDDKANGGDLGCLYVGSFSSDGTGKLSAELKISQWNESIPSLLGHLGAGVTLTLSGTEDSSSNTFRLSGKADAGSLALISIFGKHISNVS